MENKFTDKELRFIRRLYKDHEMSRYYYLAVGFLGCICILGVLLGLKYQSKDGFLMAIYFGTIAFVIMLKSFTDRKVVKIFKKIDILKDETPGNAGQSLNK